MSVVSITRDEIAITYRALLGRSPENEDAYKRGLAAGSVEELRRRILSSPEFAEKLRRDAPAALRQHLMGGAVGPAAQATDKLAPEGPPRVVFLHIMKTAGSSIRRRLEELVPDQPIWREEVDGRPGRFPAEKLLPYRVIMGHFTMADALHVPAPRRIFTILRDPRERIVSLYHFLSRHRREVIEERRMGADARIAREADLLTFLKHDNPIVRRNVQNVITCRLAGDFYATGPNRYYSPHLKQGEGVSGAELMAIALRNLLALDFVSFVDRLERDRPKLMTAIGLPDPGPLPKENTRELVSEILEPREPPEVTPEIEAELNRLTDLDRVIYRLARLHWR